MAGGSLAVAEKLIWMLALKRRGFQPRRKGCGMIAALAGELTPLKARTSFSATSEPPVSELHEKNAAVALPNPFGFCLIRCLFA